jgi:hypothetical protein
MLLTQSDILLDSLVIKQQELNKLKLRIWTDTRNGCGAYTAFNKIAVLIEGLRLLIISRAPMFGFTHKRLESDKQAWENQTSNKKWRSLEGLVCKDKIMSAYYKEPKASDSKIALDGTINGLHHLPFYDIELLVCLMKWDKHPNQKYHHRISKTRSFCSDSTKRN